MGEREKDGIYGKDRDGQSPLQSQHYRKDRIYGKDGDDVTAKLASLLLCTCSCRRVSRDVRSRRYIQGQRTPYEIRPPGPGKSHLSWCILIFPERTNLPCQCHISDGCKKW